jgi:hypothetical protein
MIEARGLTKRYGDKTAVDDLSFSVRPGVVTGFLGPNGAGQGDCTGSRAGWQRKERTMSTITTTAGQRGVGQRAAGQYKLTRAGVARSEWIKLRSLRSTWWALGAFAVTTIGTGVLLCALAAGHAAAHKHTGLSTVTLNLYGTYLAPLTIGVLGALAVTGEYMTGMIRATPAQQCRSGDHERLAGCRVPGSLDRAGDVRRVYGGGDRGGGRAAQAEGCLISTSFLRTEVRVPVRARCTRTAPWAIVSTFVSTSEVRSHWDSGSAIPIHLVLLMGDKGRCNCRAIKHVPRIV